VDATVAIIFVACFIVYVFFLRFWRPRCPQCEEARARFVDDERGQEYLTCEACGYREATGWERSR